MTPCSAPKKILHTTIPKQRGTMSLLVVLTEELVVDFALFYAVN